MRKVTKQFRRAVRQTLPPHINDIDSRDRLVEALERLLDELHQSNVATVEFVVNRDQEITDGPSILGRFRSLHPTKRHFLLAVTIGLHPPRPDEPADVAQL